MNAPAQHEYEIEHVSTYRYGESASECVMLLCLQPRHDGGQELTRFEVATQPPSCLNADTDCFGNARHVLNIHRAHDGLAITAKSSVTVAARDALPPRLDADGADAWAAARAYGMSAEDWDFARASVLARPSAALDAFVARHNIAPRDDPLESLVQLSHKLHRKLRYLPGSTSAESPIDHILESGEGVCQDYAHLMIAIARSWGLCARYVSGYLHLLGAEGEQSPENATHAWVECRLPQLGWVGFDPTNRSIAGIGHIRIAVGRDFHDVSPTRGVLQGGGETELEVDVQVRPIAASANGDK